MDPLATPLVLTKNQVPAKRPSVILRPHLVARMVEKDNQALLLVSAPAGYGKSTLLTEWAQSLLANEVAVAWYSLDTSDDNPIPFGAYVVASLSIALGSISELGRLAQLVRTSPETSIQQIFQTAINAVLTAGRECVLILDDYHLISSPAIHSALAYLVDHLPKNLRIAVGSRSDPPLPLARWRAQGRLLEIRAADLRFNLKETGDFLHEVMKLSLSPDWISTLEALTEGWIAGLQLAALTLAGSVDQEGTIASFTGSSRYLVDYLLEEVFNHQPLKIQEFLLSTSILERLSASLCEAVISGQSSVVSQDPHPQPLSQEARGENALPNQLIYSSTNQLSSLTQSSSILDYLERQNLFLVSLDDERNWYRYHHLFQDFLLKRLLRSQPERAQQLHQAACEWLASQHSLREAARHAFHTQDWEYAAAFVEKHAFTLLMHSEISTIYEWCAAFPEEIMRRHPLLCIHQCWGWVLRFRQQNRPKIEARLQLVEKTASALQDQKAAQELMEHASVVRSFLAMAPDPSFDARKYLSIAQTMLAAYPEEDTSQLSARLMSAYAFMALLDIKPASRMLDSARQIALREHLYFGVVEATFHLARLAQSQGQLSRAADLCRQGKSDLAALLDNPDQELPGVGALDIALGCVLLEQNQLDDAEECLVRGVNLVGMGMNTHYLWVGYVGLYRLHEIQGHSTEAIDYLSRLEENWPDIAFCTRGLQTVHALRNAPDPSTVISEADAWSQSFSLPIDPHGPEPGIGPLGAAEVYYLAYLAWARVQVALGHPQAALQVIARLLDRASAQNLTGRAIECSLLEALARQGAGDTQDARIALERALVAGQAGGFVRSFDQGNALDQLLVDAIQHSRLRDYARTLVTAIHPANNPTPQQPVRQVLPKRDRLPTPAAGLDNGERLSQRELDVLQLVARGASNQEIARQLFITVGTVKSHLNHILGKLDARNRTEAVARARAMGWLDL